MQNCRRGRKGLCWCSCRHRLHFGSRLCPSIVQVAFKANAGNRVLSEVRWPMLELHAWKHARAVLRGGGEGDLTSLPDPSECVTAEERASLEPTLMAVSQLCLRGQRVPAALRLLRGAQLAGERLLAQPPCVVAEPLAEATVQLSAPAKKDRPRKAQPAAQREHLP
jgi:hypothetical protein